MRVEVRQQQPPEIETDLLVVGLHDGETLSDGDGLSHAAGASEARGGFKKVTLIHPEKPARALVLGLGRREEMDAERSRVAGAIAASEAARVGAGSLAWLPPEGDGTAELVGAFVCGAILGSYRFDRFRSA